MLSDLEIASRIKMKEISEIASAVGLSGKDLDLYGTYKAKIDLSSVVKAADRPKGKLILVTTTSPTPFGEGKTTMTIGLSQAINRAGRSSVVCIREPSLGPTMGIKGGAAGGGYAQVLPMEDINLHFTGDMYMIGATHNLLSSMIDNHIYFGNEKSIDTERITWPRVVDMNDRALRDITVRYKGVERRSSFDITAASEVMAVLCLSEGIEDLKDRLKRIVIGFDVKGIPVTAGDLNAHGAMALLLKEAIKPNLVQTTEGTPAMIHGGPFANIAHGCNSVMATKLSMSLCDYTVTEAGFGSDLGAEKFFDIKCRAAGIDPDAVVLVITTKALKWQGGCKKEDWMKKDMASLKNGFANLRRHINGLKNYGLPIVAVINKFHFDDKEELSAVIEECNAQGIVCHISSARDEGSSGDIAFARSVTDAADGKKQSYAPIYGLEESIPEKLKKVAVKVYGADGVVFSEKAKSDLEDVVRSGFGGLPVCVAKTQFSFSDDHTKIGAATGFDLNIKKLKIASGAGYIVAYAGDIMTMPGLPKHPAAENMDIDTSGNIKGIF